MRRCVAMGLLATSGMNVLDSARTSVDRVYNGSRPCLGRANEIALKQEESFTEEADCLSACSELDCPLADRLAYRVHQLASRHSSVRYYY